jgi:hypothetical protein
LRLPAYRPELTPAEQLFRHLRKQLANRLFDLRKELEAALSEELRRWQANRAEPSRDSATHGLSLVEQGRGYPIISLMKEY